jgi:hypothetical protein
MELNELSLILQLAGASDAEQITGMKTADQRKKRLRKQLSPIPSGKHAALSIFDIAEMAIVQQMASLGLASNEGMAGVRRQAAGYVGYWALCHPGAVEIEHPRGDLSRELGLRAIQAARAYEPSAYGGASIAPMILYVWQHSLEGKITHMFDYNYIPYGGKLPGIDDVAEAEPYIVFPLRPLGTLLAKRFLKFRANYVACLAEAP